MSEQQCSQCAALQAQVAALQQEIEELKSVIAYLNSLIRAVSQFCSVVTIKASIMLAGHQPRGTWSIWKGRGETAHRVLEVLAGE